MAVEFEVRNAMLNSQEPEVVDKSFQGGLKRFRLEISPFGIPLHVSPAPPSKVLNSVDEDPVLEIKTQMDETNLEKKLCKGLSTSGDAIQRVEKVLSPFLRILKKRKYEKADILPTDYKDLYHKRSTKDLLIRLQAGITDPVSMSTLMNETAELLKVVTKSKGVNLYLTDYDSGELILCPKYNHSKRLQRKYAIGTYVAPHVAFTKEYVISSDILGDVRFPQGIPDVSAVKSVICLPVLTDVEDNCIAVIELYRQCSERPYDLTNLQICNALTAWMGIAFEQHNARVHLLKKMEIHSQLSEFTDLYFSGKAPFNKIISDFLKVAKGAVGAEKGAFYLFRDPVRPSTEEILWADAYEEGLDKTDETLLCKKRDRIKFIKNTPGIPGYAARTAQVINIQDAYKDYRFDKKSDSSFSKTRSVLSFPVKNDSGVLAVLNLINCLDYPYFRKEDINSIEPFSFYLGNVCSRFHLENSFKKLQFRLLITDKLLDFHSKCTLDEFNLVKGYIQTKQTFPPEFFQFEWERSGYEDDALKFIVYAFTQGDMLERCFEAQYLVDFLMRIKKSYRPVMYHNFDHAFEVFHFTYNIILRNKKAYNVTEVICLLLAALCHDIDHVGFTNGFLTLKNDTIYKLYGEFCGEAHRYELVLFFIQLTNLLSNFPEQQFQFITKHLKRLMLAFDLALHLQNRQKLITILNADSFRWEDPEHRFLSQNIILLCSDHCCSFKSFSYVRKCINQFQKELYKQGDMEKSMGFSPLSMMDRNKADMVSDNQSIYLSVVVMPCVQILVTLFPNLAILEELLSKTIAKWNELVLLRGREIWKLEDSLPKHKKTTKTGQKISIVSALSSRRTVFSESDRD